MESESQETRTSLYSILCIVIRLGAVMLVMGVVGVAFDVLGSRQSSEFPGSYLLLVVGFVVVTMLIAFLLWLHPGPLARIASGRSAHQVFESSIDAVQIQWIALSVLGMGWVMTGLLGLAHLGYQSIWMSEILGTGEEALHRLHGQIAYHVLEMLIGVALTLGARGLAGILQKVRYAGSSGMPARKPSALEDSE
jgi:hypothetical protein